MRLIISPAVKQCVDKMMGDKIFQEDPNYFTGNFCSGWSKYFSNNEINHPGGPNISIYLDRGNQKWGVRFSCDRPLGDPVVDVIILNNGPLEDLAAMPD